ncbi:hypothetical protein GGF37_006383, partial [Kickxella alabastrina]
MDGALNAIHIVRLSYSWLSSLTWYVPLDTPLSHRSSSYASSSFASDPDDKDQLSWANVGVAALLLGINVALSTWLGLGLSRNLVVSATRCVVQLTLLGMVLKQIFLTENPV